MTIFPGDSHGVDDQILSSPESSISGTAVLDEVEERDLDPIELWEGTCADVLIFSSFPLHLLKRALLAIPIVRTVGFPGRVRPTSRQHFVFAAQTLDERQQCVRISFLL